MARAMWLWSRVASGCSTLKAGLGFPEIEVGSCQGEHQILTTGPEVTERGPGPLALQKRIYTKTKSSKASKKGGGGSTACVDRYMGRLREESLSCTLLTVWMPFKGHFFSGFPLASHLDLPSSQSIFAVSQDLPLCLHISLSQDGFYWRGLWVQHPLASLPFDL